MGSGTAHRGFLESARPRQASNYFFRQLNIAKSAVDHTNFKHKLTSKIANSA